MLQHRALTERSNFVIHVFLLYFVVCAWRALQWVEFVYECMRAQRIEESIYDQTLAPYKPSQSKRQSSEYYIHIFYKTNSTKSIRMPNDNIGLRSARDGQRERGKNEVFFAQMGLDDSVWTCFALFEWVSFILIECIGFFFLFRFPLPWSSGFKLTCIDLLVCVCERAHSRHDRISTASC